MKEWSRKKVLRGKKSHNDPPYPSRTSVGPGEQRDQQHGVVQHVQGKGYQPPKTSRSESSQVPQGLSMTPLPTQVDRWTVRSRTWGSSTWLVTHILILSWIEPNQGQNTSPWAWHCRAPGLVKIFFLQHFLSDHVSRNRIVFVTFYLLETCYPCPTCSHMINRGHFCQTICDLKSKRE